jgi:hypothetical protein
MVKLYDDIIDDPIVLEMHSIISNKVIMFLGREELKTKYKYEFSFIVNRKSKI